MLATKTLQRRAGPGSESNSPHMRNIRICGHVCVRIHPSSSIHAHSVRVLCMCMRIWHVACMASLLSCVLVCSPSKPNAGTASKPVTDGDSSDDDRPINQRLLQKKYAALQPPSNLRT